MNNTDKEKSTASSNDQDKLKGSKSDPQMTELEGLKEGGKEPIVHEEDKGKDEDGNID